MLAKHFTIWIIGALVGSNQYQLTKAKESELLEKVQINSYECDEQKVYSTIAVYDSVRIRRGNDTMFTAQYFDKGKSLFTTSEFGWQFSLIAEEYKVDKSLTNYLNYGFFESHENSTFKQKYLVNDIEFDVYVSSWWSCHSPVCNHGHIQHSSKAFYCSEYGRLISFSGTYGRAEKVDLLVGVNNDTIVGNLVSKVLSDILEIDLRIKEKYEEDRRKY